jgi:hypothetical protein
VALSEGDAARWAQVARLAEERWPGLDAHGVESGTELVRRLCEDLGFTEAQSRRALDAFARNLPAGNKVWLLAQLPGRPEEAEEPAEPEDESAEEPVAEEAEEGLPGDIGTDDDWDEAGIDGDIGTDDEWD